jgi:protein SCO1/2
VPHTPRHTYPSGADRGGRVVGRVTVLVVLRLAVLAGLLGAVVPVPAQGQPQYPGSFKRYAGEVERPGQGAAVTPPQLKNVTFKQRLNEPLPLDATFKDEHGRTVRLGDYFTGARPVILAFVYYRCPMLCTQVMNGLSSALKVLPFAPGTDFDVVLVSFDPRDTPATALEKKRSHLEYWSAESTGGAWHFLTGDEATIARVTNAAGFSYQWDPRAEQFAHVSGVLVTTPTGILSRYFYGVEYSPKELRLALVESGQGKVGSAIDELLLYCFHYDPEAGRYGAVVMNLIRLGGVITLMVMAGFFWLMRRRDRAARQVGPASHAEGHA